MDEVMSSKVSNTYYGGANPDVLNLLPLTSRLMLEIGCGAGGLGRAYLARNPSARYVGVELFGKAASQAEAYLDQVIVGDIEQPAVFSALDQLHGGGAFDTLILGDVLEHLRDPWRVLADLRARMAPGSVCVACVPNVAHWSVLAQQLNGRWDYQDAGLLDRTHLRFFTLKTATEMFQQAGWTMLDVRPRVLWPEQTEAALKLFAPMREALGIGAESLRQNLSAFQWVIRAVNGPAPQPINVVGLGLKKLAGVNEPRIDHPLAALASLPTARAVWGAPDVSIPNDWTPGVFILHRQFMVDTGFAAQMEKLVDKGWLLVLDMDDDPHNWQEFVNSDFYAFRNAHAVTVSNELLAEMIRHWNPHVKIFPNAIFELPLLPPTTPKQGERLRIFFGALNRGADWAAILPGIVAAAHSLSETVEFVVVHDREFFQSLPVDHKTFHPTMPHGEYMTVLASCDIALLPLADTPFNRMKSDIKFIECCAAGVVPICSPVVYQLRAEHDRIGWFATTPDEWREAILAACRVPAELSRRRALGLEYVKDERMHCHQFAKREHWYRSLIENRNLLESDRKLRLREFESRHSV